MKLHFIIHSVQTLTLCTSIFIVGSSNSSHSNPRDQNSREERLETHLEAEASEDEADEFIDNDFKGKYSEYFWIFAPNIVQKKIDI